MLSIRRSGSAGYCKCGELDFGRLFLALLPDMSGELATGLDWRSTDSPIHDVHRRKIIRGEVANLMGRIDAGRRS